MLEKVVVREGAGGDLVAGRIEAIDEIDGGLVPAGGEPDDADFLAVAVDLAVVGFAEFEGAFEVAVGGAEGALARPGEFFRRIDHIDGALLELDGTAAGTRGDVDQLLGQADVAVMVDADLRHDVAGLAFADDACRRF